MKKQKNADHSSRILSSMHITDVTMEGKGVGRANGKVYFLEGALPGDIVRAQIYKEKKNFGLGRVCSYKEKSNMRRVCPCPYASTCSGCALMPLEERAQRSVKKRWIQDAFQRIGKMHVEVSMMPIQNEHGYRTKITCFLDQQGFLCYSRRGTHDLVRIDSCWIAHPALQQIMHFWNSMIEAKDAVILDWNSKMHLLTAHSERTQIQLRTNAEGTQVLIAWYSANARNLPDLTAWTDALQLAFPKTTFCVQAYQHAEGEGWRLLHTYTEIDHIVEQVEDLHFHLTAPAFFQVNRYTVALLFQTARDLYEDPSLTVLDFFCGTGISSLLLAKKARWVYGIDCEEASIEAAKCACRTNEVHNVKFFAAKAEDWIQHYQLEAGETYNVFVDPPRAGLPEGFIEDLMQLEIAQIVYVSCHPVTLARDYSKLAAHGYKVEKVYGLDQFLNTLHVEAVCLLTRGE